MEFVLDRQDGRARRARLEFARGKVETPAFMPVGTYGTVKAMTPEELQQIGTQIILGNTFHLMLRPGTEIIKKHGDLHDLMHWQGPILTDSGGFQVFSLAKMRKITEEGVTFASPVDGAKVFLSPEVSMQVQRDLGSDIVMCFDECTPYPAAEEVVRESMQLSLRWAERSKAAFGDNPNARHRAGRHLPRAARRIGARTDRNRLRRLRHRRAVGGRGCRRAQRYPGRGAARAAGRQTALPYGRG
jgi:queuine tRNA-ribosyltransferase